MPFFSPDQSDAVIRAHGLDPSQWTMSDDGKMMTFGGQPVMPPMPIKQQQQPSTTPQAQFTPTETFVKSAIDAAPSTAAGGLSGLAVGEAAAGAVTPWSVAAAPATGGLSLLVPPVVGLGSGLLTTMGVGWGAKKIQESLETEQYKQRLAAMQQEHPTAAFLGGVAALPAGGMLPSPTGLAKGLGAIPKMVAGGVKAATPEELQSLVNVGMGAGIAGTQAAVSGESPEGVAEEAAVGALFNKQWGSENSRTVADPKKFQRMLEGISSPTPPPNGAPAPAPTGPNLLNPPGVHIDARTRTIVPDSMEPAPAPAMQPPQQPQLPAGRPELPAPAAGPESMMSPRMLSIDNADRDMQQEAARIAQQESNERTAGEIKAGMESGIARPEVREGKAIISPLSKLEAQNLRESPADLAARQAEAKAAGEPAPQYQRQETLTPAAQQLKDYVDQYLAKTGRTLKLGIDNNYFNTIAREVTGLHGITDVEAPELEKKGVLGQAIGGLKSLINPFRADVSTQFHEASHHIQNSMTDAEYAQLKEATRPDFEKFIKENPDWLKDYKNIDQAHDEFIASESGYKSVLRALNASGETGLGRYWNDLKAIWKTRYGKEPTAEEVLRSHEYKLVNGISDLTKMRINAGTINPAAREQERAQGLPRQPAPAGVTPEVLPPQHQLALGQKALEAPPIDIQATVEPQFMRKGVAAYNPKDLTYDEVLKNDLKILPHENVRQFYRDNGQYPDKKQMRALGYTPRDYVKMQQESPALFKILNEPSAFDRKRAMEAAQQNYLDSIGKPGQIEAHAQYLQSIKDHFNRVGLEEMYGRSGYQKTEVQAKPTVTRKTGTGITITPARGFFTHIHPETKEELGPWQGKIVAKPSEPRTASHETGHEIFHEEMIRNPEHMTELLRPLRNDTDFNESLRHAANHLRDAYNGYEHLPADHAEWMKQKPDEHSYAGASKIIDEALAHVITNRDPELVAHGRNILSKTFGNDSVYAHINEGTPIGRELMARYHKPSEGYFQREGLAGYTPKTREQRLEDMKKTSLERRKAQAAEMAQIRQRQAETDRAFSNMRAVKKGLPTEEGPVEPAKARGKGQMATVLPQQEGYTPVGGAPRREPYVHSAASEEIIRRTVNHVIDRMTALAGRNKGPWGDKEEIASRVKASLLKEGVMPEGRAVSAASRPLTGEQKQQTYLNRVSGTAAMEAKRAYYDIIRERAFEGTSLQKKVGRGEGVELGELIAAPKGEEAAVPSAGETEVQLKPSAGRAVEPTAEEKAAEEAHMTAAEKKAAAKKTAEEAKTARMAKAAEKKFTYQEDAEVLHNRFKDMLEDDDERATNNKMPDMQRKTLEAAVDRLSKMPPRTPVDANAFMRETMAGIGKTKVAAEEGQYQRYGLSGHSPHATEGQKYSFYKTRAEIDEALKKAPESGLIYRALQALPNVRDRLFARYFNPIADAAKGMSEAQKNSVLNRLYNEDILDKANPPQHPQELKLYNAIRQSLLTKQREQMAAGQMVTAFDAHGRPYKRLPQVNKNYAPSLMRSDVLNALVERTGKWQQYENQLKDHWRFNGMSEPEIEERLRSFREIENDSEKNETRFAANRLAEGAGIPAELREQRLEKAFQRYFGRVAMDRSYYDTVESKMDVMKNLNDNSHAYKDIISNLKGSEFDKSENTMKAINRVFTSAMLGPITNLHIGFSSLFNPMQYMKFSELGSVYGKAMADWSGNNQAAIKNGYLKRDFTTFKDIIDKNLTFTQKMGALAQQIGKLGGREWTDAASKTVAQGLAEQIVPLRLADAERGDIYGQRIIKQLDPYWTPGKQYSPEQKSQMASTLAGFIHGAHDYRTLPAWMNKETILKPFFSLMSWSTAQTNQWMKHVFEPATRGNVQPLLLSVLGAALGGYTIQQLRQFVSDKKTNIPSLTEIAQSRRGLGGNLGLLGYNFAQMASYTGLAGLGSTAAKDIYDIIYKNSPQGAAFPADEAISSIAKTSTDALQAWAENPSWENFGQIAMKAVTDMTRENVQLARIASNWAADYGVAPSQLTYQKQLSDKEMALRRWRMAEGMPYEPEGALSGANTLRNLQMKQFKQTTNIPEAASELPSLLQLARQRAQGNPEVLRQQLEALKQNSYESMPSPERMPLQFSQYLQYVGRTQGPAAAQALMSDYMRRNALNKAKESFVP